MGSLTKTVFHVQNAGNIDIPTLLLPHEFWAGLNDALLAQTRDTAVEGKLHHLIVKKKYTETHIHARKR